jgi:hypothetical protein
VTPATLLLALVTAEWLAELWLARCNTAALLAKGAFEVAPGHYPLIVLLHAVWLLGLWLIGWADPLSRIWLVFGIAGFEGLGSANSRPTLDYSHRGAPYFPSGRTCSAWNRDRKLFLKEREFFLNSPSLMRERRDQEPYAQRRSCRRGGRPGPHAAVDRIDGPQAMLPTRRSKRR